jgi:5-methylcytosine-specific restriction protein A
MPRTAWVPSPAARERRTAPKPGARRQTGFPQWVRDAVDARSLGLCEVCGVRPWAEVHHRRPRAAGGSRRPSTNLPGNALALCSEDHRRAESHRNWALVHGWLVNQQQDEPSLVQVQLHHGWVRLDDVGRYEPSEGVSP